MARPLKPADPKFPKRKASREAGQNSETPEAAETPGSEEIGLSGETPAAETPKPNRYWCGNCKGEIHQGDKECPTCELELDWSTTS